MKTHKAAAVRPPQERESLLRRPTEGQWPPWNRFQPEGGRFLLLAPETPADQTSGMLRRLAREVEDQMGIRFRYSIADFPNAALTSEELLRKVSEDLRRGGDEANDADGPRQAVGRPVVQEEHVL